MRQLCLTVTNPLSLQCFKLRNTFIQPPPMFAEPLISTLGLSRYNRYWTYSNVLLESKSSFYPEILFFKAPICEKVDCWVLFWVHEILKLWICRSGGPPSQSIRVWPVGKPKVQLTLTAFILQEGQLWNTPTATAQDTLLQVKEEEKKKEREAQKQLKVLNFIIGINVFI